MADTISLHCRIAALETELRLVKEQLSQYQNSTISLAGLLVRDPRPVPDQQQHQIDDQQIPYEQLQREISSTREQLNYALQVNANLERQLEASKWADSVAEAKEESSEDLLGGSVCGKEPEIWGTWSDTEEHLYVRGEVQSPSPRGVQDGWTKLSDNVPIKDRSMADPLLSTHEKGLADGMQGWNAVVADYKRRTRSSVAGNKRFMAHEHNRLAGVSCWVKDLSGSEYDRYWEDYADLHQDHTAKEWKQYYEAEIRPRAPAGTPLVVSPPVIGPVVVSPQVATPPLVVQDPFATDDVEAATAQSVHIRSYSMEDVTKYDVQPAAVPPAPSRHIPPRTCSIGPWPKPETRPFERQQLAAWPKPPPRPFERLPYEVTHLLNSTDTTLRRTVLVSEVPIGMTLAELLEGRLKSDRIVDAKFAGTAGMKTLPPIQSNMALVEFFDHEDARVYVDSYSGKQGFTLDIFPSSTRPLRRARVDSGYD